MNDPDLQADRIVALQSASQNWQSADESTMARIHYATEKYWDVNKI
jgi:hypothetical protein